MLGLVSWSVKWSTGPAGVFQEALGVRNLPANAGDIKDTGSIPGLGRSLGGGHGKSLQYSCLENPRDRGTWWATVHGVTKSQRQLNNLAYTHDLQRFLPSPWPWNTRQFDSQQRHCCSAPPSTCVGWVTCPTQVGWLRCHPPHRIKGKNLPYAVETNILLFSKPLSKHCTLLHCTVGRGVFLASENCAFKCTSQEVF